MRERVKSAGGYPSGREDRVATAKKVFLTKKERREESDIKRDEKGAAVRNDDDGARKGRGCTASQPRPPGNYDYYLWVASDCPSSVRRTTVEVLHANWFHASFRSRVQHVADPRASPGEETSLSLSFSRRIAAREEVGVVLPSLSLPTLLLLFPVRFFSSISTPFPCKTNISLPLVLRARRLWPESVLARELSSPTSNL